MNQSNDPSSAAQKITDFLQTLVNKGGLDLKSEILACNGQVQSNSSLTTGAFPSAPTETSASTPDFKVNFSGPDTSLLLAHNGELLNAIEHVAAKILRLESEEHDRICFDADGFKITRDHELQVSAQAAIQKVRDSGLPYAFPSMTSRERRMLHLVLARSGLPTASSGEGPRRFVVLYPEDHQPSVSKPVEHTPERTRAIRNSFRPR